MKSLLSKKRVYTVKNPEGKLKISEGEIDFEKTGIGKNGDKIKTHKGKEFTVVEPNLIDLMGKMKRGAQVITPKDASLILAYTGIPSDSLIVDAGSGSGFLSIFLANYCKEGKIVTYERNEEFHKKVIENIKLSCLKNIEAKKRDVLKKFFDEKDVDMVTLDMKGAEKIVSKCHGILKSGGWLVVYSPHIEQVEKVRSEIEKNDFTQVRTVESIVREWKSDYGFTRPKNKGLVHTGWLTFARKF
jgi:tRNA (adenine57-N1/adenine58-N1)-methyltransferase